MKFVTVKWNGKKLINLWETFNNLNEQGRYKGYLTEVEIEKLIKELEEWLNSE